MPPGVQVSEFERYLMGENPSEMSLGEFFDRKYKWSLKTFGEKPNAAPLIKHVRREVKECADQPGDLIEWVDVVLLALDGAARYAHANGHEFVAAMMGKQIVNCRRKWRVDEQGVNVHVPSPVCTVSTCENMARYILPGSNTPTLCGLCDMAAGCKGKRASDLEGK